MSKKYLSHNLQRFTGYSSKCSPPLLRHLSYQCTKVGMPVSQESTVNVSSHEITAACTSPSRKSFPATWRRFRAAMSETSGVTDQKVPKLWSADSARSFTAHFRSVLAIPGTAGHYGLRHAHWFDHQWISRTIVWPYWNFAVGWRQYQCSHFFFLAFCHNYCVTRLKLHCIIPTYSLSTATHANSRQTSHTISGRDCNLLFKWTSCMI